MKKILLLVSIFASLHNFAQFQEDEMPDVLTIGVGAGFTSFLGDLTSGSNVSKFSNIRPGYYFNLERRFGKIAGVQLEGTVGKLSANERTKEIDKNRNFESPLLQVGANFVFHFDNDLIIHKNSPFSPYISAGIQFLKFDPQGDMKDKNGIAYKYWDNGTIWNQAQGDTTTGAAQLHRDYVYETQLKDSVVNYKRSTFAVPLTFGLKWKFTPRIQGRIFASYNITFSDWIDNVKDGKNDKYIFGGFSLHYVIKKVDQDKKHRYDDVDFSAIDNSDKDGDGVLDKQDFCQNTPKGIEVDGKGCPLDKDGDGIADYLDKEPDTKKGAVVDEEGRELTDELLASRIAEKNKITEERKQSFSEDASQSKLDEISKQIESSAKVNNGAAKTSNIPLALQEADLDNNGIISSKEISAAIDGFFEGSNDFTVKKLHDLIDYFFEQ